MGAPLAPAFGGLSPTASPSVGVAIRLRASTAFEGVAVSWNESPRDLAGVRLVRNKRHAPQRVDDGLVIFAADRRPAAPRAFDARVLPERFYFYALFVYELGQWVKPEGCEAMAWSGAPLRVDEDPAAVTTLLESIGHYAGSAMIANPALFAPGRWLRLGPEGDSRDLSRVAWSVVSDRVYFEPLGHLGAPSARAVYGQRLRFANSGGAPLIERYAGSWRDDGFAERARIVIEGTATATGANGARGVVQVDDRLLWLDGAAFAASETTRAARVEESPGLLVGAPVTRLHPRGPRLVRQMHGWVPSEWRADDEAVGQGRVLEETVAVDGQLVSVGSPGLEWGYQRFLRLVSLLLARKASTFASLRQLIDVDTAPAAALRGVASLIDYRPPEDADDVRTRALIMQRGALVRAKGVLPVFLAQLRSLLGQYVTVLYGRDRVIRLNEAGSGLVSSWGGLLTDLAAHTFTDGLAAWMPGGLVGWHVMIGTDPATTFPIVANAATAGDTDPAGASLLAAGGGVFTGTADAPEAFYADASGPSGHLSFVAATQSLVRADGVAWTTKGYAVGQEIRASGAVNAANNGWVTIASLTGSTMGVTGATLVDEDSTTAIVEGGVTENDLCDAAAAYTPAALVGEWLVPKISDSGGPDDHPRAFLVTANTAKRITVEGGDLRAVAVGGTSYRVAPWYSLRAPVGGRKDPRQSVYAATPDSPFNDRGLFVYVDADPGVAALRELGDRIGLGLPSGVGFVVIADAGGGLSPLQTPPIRLLDVDLLAEERALEPV